jgi:pimeloyl-ACP methyl ester carboxylesterase
MNPVLMVHGLATSAERTWRETGWIDLLEDMGREVVAIDLPGHGGQPSLPSAADYDRLDDIVLEAMPDGTCDAVGFSIGARLVLGLAARNPDRFDRVVLAGIGAGILESADNSSFAEKVRKAADGENAKDSDDPITRHFTQLAAESNSDLDAVVAILQRRSLLLEPGELAAVTAKVLVVVGEHDVAGPAQPLADALPDATAVTLPGVDHFSTPKAMGFLDAGLTFLE